MEQIMESNDMTILPSKVHCHALSCFQGLVRMVKIVLAKANDILADIAAFSNDHKGSFCEVCCLKAILVKILEFIWGRIESPLSLKLT